MKHIAVRLAVLLVLSYALPGVVAAQAPDNNIHLSSTGWHYPDGRTEGPVGTWGPNTLMGKLTRDLSTGIVIDRDHLTLDGDGHVLNGSASGEGVAICSRTHVTVKNLRMHGFETGIYLCGSTSAVTVTNNAVIGSTYGIYLVVRGFLHSPEQHGLGLLPRRYPPVRLA